MPKSDGGGDNARPLSRAPHSIRDILLLLRLPFPLLSRSSPCPRNHTGSPPLIPPLFDISIPIRTQKLAAPPFFPSHPSSGALHSLTARTPGSFSTGITIVDCTLRCLVGGGGGAETSTGLGTRASLEIAVRRVRALRRGARAHGRGQRAGACAPARGAVADAGAMVDGGTRGGVSDAWRRDGGGGARWMS